MLFFVSSRAAWLVDRWRKPFPLWTVLLSSVVARAVRSATSKVTFCHCLVFHARVLLSSCHLSCPLCLTRGGWMFSAVHSAKYAFAFLHVCTDIVSSDSVFVIFILIVKCYMWQIKWISMKWNEMKWNEMKWNEMKWNEMKWKKKKIIVHQHFDP